MSTETFLQIKNLLDAHHIDHQHVTHAHVQSSSEQAALVRGTNLSDAAKAIVMKAERRNGAVDVDARSAGEGPADKYFYIQAVIAADQRIDLKKLKQLLDVKNLALASPQEVLERTGCEIGSVPPFGQLFDIPVYMDDALLKKEFIVFSAGTHTDSIIIHPADYYILVEPIVKEFKKE